MNPTASEPARHRRRERRFPGGIATANLCPLEESALLPGKVSLQHGRLYRMIREANSGDFDALSNLLEANRLRSEGVLEDGTRYWVACNDTGLVGAIGLELGTRCALLRSAVVSASERGRGLGRALTETALKWACDNGYRTVYCFSTDARSYWAARGFDQCAVDEVVNELPHAPQVGLFRALGWLPTEIAFRKVCKTIAR